MLRVEDDALLRGEGRFLDDLAPVARTCHAAVVRSQLAHARIEVDATAALALPGVVGVLTGDPTGREVFSMGVSVWAEQETLMTSINAPDRQQF